MKKILSYPVISLLILVALIIAIPTILPSCIILPNASGNDTPDATVEFTFISNGDGTCSVTNISDLYAETIVIPEKSPDGETVVKVEYQMFWTIHELGDIEKLRTIYLPKSLSEIDPRVFELCYGLENIYVDAENKSFASRNGHLYSKDLKALLAYARGNPAKVFNIPYETESIESYAFSKSSKLTEVNLTKNVKVIGDCAFSSCSSLRTVTFPQAIDLVAFGSNVFERCTALEEISLPSCLRTIRENTFLGCTALVNVTLPEGLKTIDAYSFNGCAALASINIPNSVIIVGEYAFADCASLNNIKLPDGLTSLDTAAFKNCISLKQINLPDGITRLSETFSGCSALETIDISENSKLDRLLGRTFMYCSSLTEIFIPKTVEMILANDFRDCTSLSRVHITDLDSWLSTRFTDRESNPLNCGASLYLNGEAVTEVTIAAGSTHLRYLFAGCTSLEKVTLSEGITTVGLHAFYGCTNLSEVNLPSSITRIDGYAFYNCVGITDVYYSGSEEQWSNIYVYDGNDALLEATKHYRNLVEN